MVLEVEEDNPMAGLKPSTSERKLASLQKRGNLIMTKSEEILRQEAEEVKVEVEELLIVAINAISWDIDSLSVQTMKKQDTMEHM